MKFCSAYFRLMQEDWLVQSFITYAVVSQSHSLFCRFKKFFGLKDFIHFINYIRRNYQDSIDASLVLQSLERNFNGIQDFKHICSVFLEMVKRK